MKEIKLKNRPVEVVTEGTELPLKTEYPKAIMEAELPKVMRDSKVEPAMSVPTDFFARFEQQMNAVIDAQEAKNSDQTPAAAEPAKPQAPVVSMPARAAKTFSWSRVAAVITLVLVVGLGYMMLDKPAEVSSAPSYAETDEVMLDEMSDDLNEVFSDQSEEVFYASVSDMEVYDLFCEL